MPTIAAAVNLFFKLGRTTAAKNAALKLLNRKRFTGELARKIKARSIKKGFMKESDELSKKTGLKVGERQRDYSDPDFIAKQKAGRLVKPSVNLTEYNLARKKEALKRRGIDEDSDLTLLGEEGGMEGLIKGALAGEKSSTLGTTLRDDKSFIKGILSLARAAELYNPGTRANIIQKANLMKYKQQVEPYLAQLDDVERQIRYWLSEGDAADVAKIKQLMSRYTELKKSVDPKYWHARGVTWGHPGALKVNVENVLKGGPGKKFSEYLTKDPKGLTRYDPEIGPVNVGKDSRDAAIMEAIRDADVPVTRKGLDQMSDLYTQAGVRSIMPSPTGKRMILGKHDLIKQIDFLTNALRKNKDPFHGINKKQIREILAGVSNLGKFGYQAGGLVGIGSKILAKLAKKLSEKELKMLMGSLWKGVDPKQAPHYKAWAKNRWGPGYKWPYKKSRIRGPEMKKSHYASLSDQAKEDLRKRYAKRLAEYIAKKKRGG